MSKIPAEIQARFAIEVASDNAMATLCALLGREEAMHLWALGFVQGRLDVTKELSKLLKDAA